MVEFLKTAVRPSLVVAIDLAIWALVLPFVLVWKFRTAGSDCGCWCDEDD